MFGDRYFGPRFFGNRYFGPGGIPQGAAGRSSVLLYIPNEKHRVLNLGRPT